MKRSIAIANCSGCNWDQGSQMAKQITEGHIDAVYGDYLAEMNLSDNARAYRTGAHLGWEKTAEDGILLSLPLIDEIQKKEQRTIKIIVNGGALNPRGLAELVAKEVAANNYNLKVAYVSGDELIDRAPELLKRDLEHLDSVNSNIRYDPAVSKFSEKLHNDVEDLQIVSCNAYLGGRAILKGLENGADIIICGRISDTSPVVALASWWHGWSATSYDQLAGALMAGHLTECSAYSCGANFSDFWRYPVDDLMDLGFPIAEISNDGTFVVTKHPSLNGIVNIDTVRTQFLYELQGTEFLHSDVKVVLDNVMVESVGLHRVKFSGITGAPPPSTTKLAIFWNAGYQSQVTAIATGTASQVDAKFDLYEKQLRLWLTKQCGDKSIIDDFDVLEFQRFAHPDPQAPTQNRGSSFMRIFAQAQTKQPLVSLKEGVVFYGMQHYSGYHFIVNAWAPRDINTFFPSTIAQEELEETVTFIGGETYAADNLVKCEPVGPRKNYEPEVCLSTIADKFGPTVTSFLSEVVLSRSGDKGSNSNIGFFVHEDDEFQWLRSYFTSDKLRELIGEDWKEWYHIERVEFPGIKAVHFVIYGILGRGVSSSSRLDNLGKGFADWITSKEVEIPKKFVDRYKGKRYSADQWS